MSMYASALQGATAKVQPISEYIKIQHLALIKWKDNQGHIQGFYLMDKIAYKWRTLGELLGLPFSKNLSYRAWQLIFYINLRSVVKLF